MSIPTFWHNANPMHADELATLIDGDPPLWRANSHAQHQPHCLAVARGGITRRPARPPAPIREPKAPTTRLDHLLVRIATQRAQIQHHRMHQNIHAAAHARRRNTIPTNNHPLQPSTHRGVTRRAVVNAAIVFALLAALLLVAWASTTTHRIY